MVKTIKKSNVDHVPRVFSYLSLKSNICLFQGKVIRNEGQILSPFYTAYVLQLTAKNEKNI
jgi:hypothetical protein